MEGFGQTESTLILGNLAAEYEASSDLQKEIREFCNLQLAEYKWIRIIEFVDEMRRQ